jgi:purine-binding chemotaxis protein CheW
VAISTPSTSDAVEKLVCFALGGQELALPIRAVKETLPLRPVTRVFLVPPVVAGLINLRGEVVAVLDLSRLIGIDHVLRDDAAIVILRPAEPGARASNRAACGLIVDRLLGVREVAGAALQPAPPTLSPEPASYLRGVASVGEPPAPLLVLDPERVLNCEPLKPYRRKTAQA